MTPNIASTASTTYDPKTGKNVLNVKIPCNYRKEWILGVADHEVATHFLRRHNEKHQFFAKKKEKYEIKSCIKTEEGLAGLNQLIRTVSNPLLLFYSSLGLGQQQDACAFLPRD